MGEIRLKIPDTLHYALKVEAGRRGKRLPDFITKVLRDYIVAIRKNQAKITEKSG